MIAAATVDAVIERVATQSVVLSALHWAAGGKTVWPWSPVRDLRLSQADMAIAAHALSVELHVNLTASALGGEGTVDDLVDRIFVLKRNGREHAETLAARRSRRDPQRVVNCVSRRSTMTP